MSRQFNAVDTQPLTTKNSMYRHGGGSQFQKLSNLLNAVTRFKNLSEGTSPPRGTTLCRYGRDVKDMSGSKKQQITNILKDRREAQFVKAKQKMDDHNPFVKYLNGTLSLDNKINNSSNDNAHAICGNQLPETVSSPPPEDEDDRPLKLPPVILPPIHTARQRVPEYRHISPPDELRKDIKGRMSETEWRDLKYCRYLRLSKTNKARVPPLRQR